MKQRISDCDSRGPYFNTIDPELSGVRLLTIISIYFKWTRVQKTINRSTHLVNVLVSLILTPTGDSQK